MIMKQNNSIKTVLYLKIKDLTILRKSCVEWRQKEIDKELNELQKLKEDVKKSR